MSSLIDLRSEAMARAEVGDDVFSDAPTAPHSNRLAPFAKERKLSLHLGVGLPEIEKVVQAFREAMAHGVTKLAPYPANVDSHPGVG